MIRLEVRDFQYRPEHHRLGLLFLNVSIRVIVWLLKNKRLHLRQQLH